MVQPLEQMSDHNPPLFINTTKTEAVETVDSSPEFKGFGSDDTDNSDGDSPVRRKP